MKSDLKEGVSKAAGKLSSLASSVMSSIQVRIKTKRDFFVFNFHNTEIHIFFYRENRFFINNNMGKNR
jgi:hypothetical protein